MVPRRCLHGSKKRLLNTVFMGFVLYPMVESLAQAARLSQGVFILPRLRTFFTARRGRPAFAALAAIALSGCTSPSPFGPWARLSPDWIIGAYQDPTSLPGPRPAATTPSKPLGSDTGVETYVRIALQRAPAIHVAEQRIAELKARIPQVTSLDDPMFQIAPVGEMAQTASGQVQVMTGISQKLPWPDKLNTKGQIVESQIIAASANLERVKLHVAGQTRRAYWQLYAATRSLQQIKRTRPLLVQIRQVAMAHVRAGQAGQADVLRTGVEIAELDRKAADFRQQHDTSVAMLNRLMNRAPDATIADPPVIKVRQVHLRERQLLAEAAEQNPAIAAIHANIQANRKKLHLADLARIPDLTLSAGYNAVSDEGLSMAANGRDQWWLGFGFNIPLWNDKYDAMQRQARAGILQSLSQLNDVQQQVSFDVKSAIFAVDSRQEQVRLFRQEILPQARQAVDDALASYRAGRMGFVDALDVWRRLLTLELTDAQNRAGLGKALADLREAVAQPLATNRPSSKTHSNLQAAWTQSMESR